MNLNELRLAVSEKTELSKAEAGSAVDAVLDCIRDALSKGDKVALSGFGNFEIADRPAREGRNPATGQPMQIAASKAVKFKAGKSLKDSVNG